uniref:Uncharacterized protein n=1 Tax=Siphoviridae sp. ctitf6 TaxID=2825627 RepID=A0A8S5P3T3_9CAUD|nr:MAG TPA: hypothetical protein [Siphoviridae sp. ctitf6]
MPASRITCTGQRDGVPLSIIIWATVRGSSWPLSLNRNWRTKKRKGGACYEPCN